MQGDSATIKNLHFIEFRRVSATPCCNYSLLYILLLDVSCSTVWNLEKHKLLFAVAILYCILSIRDYITSVFHEVLFTKVLILAIRQNMQFCKEYLMKGISDIVTNTVMVIVKSISDCINYHMFEIFSLRYYLQNIA